MPEPLGLHQNYGDVELHLDGNAHAWAWTPNIDDPDERLQLDLQLHLAFYCQAGRGKRVEPATWHNDGSLTIVVSVDLGSAGSAAISGQPISERAVVDLATAGLLATIRAGMDADLIGRRGRQRRVPGALARIRSRTRWFVRRPNAST